jgi:hypothetical protein
MSLSGAQVTRLWPYGGPGFNYGSFAGKTAGGDTTPDQFEFSDQSGVALSSTTTSAPVTITGIDAAAAITVSGGTYDINESGTFTADPGTVNNGDTVRARHTSSASYVTATNTTITIGGVSDTFTSITEGDPAQAAYIYRPFSFNWWKQ